MNNQTRAFEDSQHLNLRAWLTFRVEERSIEIKDDSLDDHIPLNWNDAAFDSRLVLHDSLFLGRVTLCVRDTHT
jgi:hypothetical protein